MTASRRCPTWPKRSRWTGRLLAPARRLEALGRVELGWRTVHATPCPPAQDAPLRNELATEQRAALDAIGALVPAARSCSKASPPRARPTCTSPRSRRPSGGWGAIVLVPEVSLIPQIADRLRSVVGDELAVLHSGLSGGERHDEWWRILRGDAAWSLGRGPRSSLPRSLLIVVDEEHDGGYKSDRTPRYDAAGSPATGRALRRAARARDGDARPRDAWPRPRRPRRARAARRATGRAESRRSRSSTCGRSWPAGIGRSSRPS